MSDPEESLDDPAEVPPMDPAQPPANEPQDLPNFSLTPATAHGGILDYTTASGRKLYASATAKLEEDLFDCVADDLYLFLKALKDRAREYGWDEEGIGILSILNDPNNPTEFKSLIESHGEIDLSTIHTFEESYLNGRINIL